MGDNTLLILLGLGIAGIGGYFLYKKIQADENEQSSDLFGPPTNLYIEDRYPDIVIEDRWPDYVYPLSYYQPWPTYTYYYPYFVPQYFPRWEGWHKPGRQPTPEAPSNTIPLPSPDPQPTPASPTLVQPPQNADVAMQNYLSLWE